MAADVPPDEPTPTASPAYVPTVPTILSWSVNTNAPGVVTLTWSATMWTVFVQMLLAPLTVVPPAPCVVHCATPVVTATPKTAPVVESKRWIRRLAAGIAPGVRMYRSSRPEVVAMSGTVVVFCALWFAAASGNVIALLAQPATACWYSHDAPATVSVLPAASWSETLPLAG